MIPLWIKLAYTAFVVVNKEQRGHTL